MSIIAFIQARLGSTRLPGKVLHDLHGKPVLTRVVERVQRATNVDRVVVVTTLESHDLPLVRLCTDLGIQVYCGSENDVLDRFYQAARILQTEHIVRITADCPVMDSALIEKIVERHLLTHADYTSNTLIERYPDGEDIEVFTFSSLEKAWKEAELLSEREHVTPYMKKHPDFFKQESVECEEDYSMERWTLDTDRDYSFLSAIYNKLAPNDEFFGVDKVLALLQENPELRDLNNGITRNEGYAKSLREDAKRS